ncbi:MAG: hypothetical protein ACI8R9_001182 [Paraglaciecola sp.]|jgi:hypothetical protein
MGSLSVSQQSDIFCDSQHQRYFAEICNALYERELFVLSQTNVTDISLLQRRIGGLRHHINHAAFHFINHNGSLAVDVHNASWQAKQTTKCMATKHDPVKATPWFRAHGRLGLPVPVHVATLGAQHIELDCIDRIEDQRLHLNKYGWYWLSGEPHGDDNKKSDSLKTRLLQPNKALLSAACCGHSWDHNGRTTPRPLSLRELLLSANINWKTFR